MSKPDFKMPGTYVGQIVYRKHSASDDKPVPAIVTAIGTNVIALSAFHPSLRNQMTYDGVTHETDPRADRAVEDGSGVWVHVEESPQFVAYAALKAAGRSKSKASE